MMHPLVGDIWAEQGSLAVSTSMTVAAGFAPQTTIKQTTEDARDCRPRPG